MDFDFGEFQKREEKFHFEVEKNLKSYFSSNQLKQFGTKT